MEKVSWEDAQIFLTRLNAIEQSAGRLPSGWKYVLPTEAEWEYACRAGTTAAYSWGNDINSSHANYNWDGSPNDGNDFKQTRPIGLYSANQWGFFDMHGNVWGIGSDWKASYLTGAQSDPGRTRIGEQSSGVVLLGGKGPSKVRSASRSEYVPSFVFSTIGFRVGFKASQARHGESGIGIVRGETFINPRGGTKPGQSPRSRPTMCGTETSHPPSRSRDRWMSMRRALIS